jgi:hypothetical protein
MMSGAYEEDSGVYFIREGEHTPILQHFDLLHITRLQQKKAIKEYGYKTVEYKYEPFVSAKSKIMAEN